MSKPKTKNILSMISLGISLVAPLLNFKLQALGIPVKLGSYDAIPLMGMLFLTPSVPAIFALVQAAGTLIGGLLADGAFNRSPAAVLTSLVGIIGAGFTVAAAFGFNASPEVQTVIAAFAAKLIAFFSSSPMAAESE